MADGWWGGWEPPGPCMTSDLLEQRPGFVWAGASAQVFLAGPGAPVLARLWSFGDLEPLGPPTPGTLPGRR